MFVCPFSFVLLVTADVFLYSSSSDNITFVLSYMILIFKQHLETHLVYSGPGVVRCLTGTWEPIFYLYVPITPRLTGRLVVCEAQMFDEITT